MPEPIQITIEILLGGVLLYLSIRSQLSRITELFEKYFGRRERRTYFARITTRLILGLVGAHLLLDPFIPGQPTIHVYAPSKFPTVLENLRVRIAPIKFDGNIDPTRTYHARFAKDSIVSAVVVFNILEQNIQLILYDETQPENPLGVRIVRLSPYVRRGFWDKHVYF